MGQYNEIQQTSIQPFNSGLAAYIFGGWHYSEVTLRDQRNSGIELFSMGNTVNNKMN